MERLAYARAWKRVRVYAIDDAAGTARFERDSEPPRMPACLMLGYVTIGLRVGRKF